LELTSDERVGAVVRDLGRLLIEARELDGFHDCYVMRTGPYELTMITIYDSEAASHTASDQLRPKLAAAIGPEVARPPERVTGEIVAGGESDPRRPR
jgi:hypothetical protein